MTGLKAEEQLKQENGNIFNNKEKISSVLKTAVKDKLGQMDCLIGKYYVIPVKKSTFLVTCFKYMKEILVNLY